MTSMTILADDGQLVPGTHVLIVGVGHYPHLEEGEGKRFSMPMKMGQLSSPRHSVKELADWFSDTVGGFNNPDRPLRSLQVLCSSDTPLTMHTADLHEVEVARARTQEVKNAIEAWIGRASRNPENLAVFAFCGHGLAFGEAENALLMEDFGSSEGNPMAHAIAFDSMRLGVMRHCAAQYQMHLIDACRTPPSAAFLATFGDDATGDPVVVAGLNRALRDKLAPVYFATGLAAPAYGLTGKPSLFTQGLLQSMRGPGSRDKDLHWEVQMSSLAEGVNKCIATMAFQVQPQYCQPRESGREFMLHRLRAPPEVLVKIYMRDEALLPSVVLAHVNEDNKRGERTPMPSPWWVALSTGNYRFEAVSSVNKEILGERKRYVMPPAAEVGL